MTQAVSFTFTFSMVEVSFWLNDENTWSSSKYRIVPFFEKTLYSAFAYHGPPIVYTIASELAELLRQDGFTSVHEAIGVNHQSVNYDIFM